MWIGKKEQGITVTAPKERNSEVVAWALVVALSAAYFLVMIPRARYHPLSTDEVFAAHITTSIPVSRLTAALGQGLDSLPPGYFLLLKGMCRLFGPSPLTLRLPSVLGFFVFLVAIFVLLRGRIGVPVATLAMALPILTEAGLCATLARPYAIVCAVFGATVLLWSRADAWPRVWRSVAFTALLALAIGVHFYAVLLVVALGIMELLWSFRYSKIRWSNWIGLAAGGASVLAWWPVILPIYRWTHASTVAPGYFARPSVAALVAKMAHMLFTDNMAIFALAFLCLAAPSYVLSRAWKDQPGAKAEANGDLDIVALSALALPVLTLVFAALVTGAFNTRYFYASVLGVSVLAAVAIRRLPFAGIISSILTYLFVLSLIGSSLWSREDFDPRLELLKRATASVPIVVAEGSDLFELMESAPLQIRQRLVYIGMPAESPNPDPEPQKMVSSWKAFRSDLTVVPATEFVARTERFYVLCTGGGREGVTDWLVRRNTIKPVDRVGNIWLFEGSGGESLATR